VKAEIKSSLQNNIRTELKEIEDQKQRGLNLIIFNVPESKSENSLERKKFDNDIFTELCNAIEVVEADVKVAFRLGNPKKETNRPLKFTCPFKVLGRVFFKGLSECQRNVCAF
jgi:hypothetical protein